MPRRSRLPLTRADPHREGRAVVSHPPDLLRVRSWYGLRAELGVEDRLWHLVRIGRVTLSHPLVVNKFLRAGLPEAERLRLSYLHDFGHLQTLPIALVHAAIIMGAGLRQRRSFVAWIGWLLAALLEHEATWDFASESNVVLGDRSAYRQTYRDHPNPFSMLFWAGMALLSLGLGPALLRRTSTR